eukprot:COSAG04_NODE_3842_length_2482_cov_1.516995_4_plen_292_part_01
MRRSADKKAAGGGAEEGAPERPKPPEREAARGAAQPEPEPEFCDEQLAEPEPEPERLRVAWDCAGATKEGQLIFLSAGDVVQVAERPKDHWIIVRKTSGETGLVPETYFRALEEQGAAKPEPEPQEVPSFVVAGPHEQRHWDHITALKGTPEPEPELCEPEPDPRDIQPEPEPEDVESDDSEDRTHGGGESIVPAGMSRQLSGATSTATADAATAGGGAQSLPTAAEFCGPTTGISLGGLLHMVELLGPRLTAETTTSDVCHAFIKPMTTPAGWADEATLTDAAQRWYKHSY